MSEPFFFPLSFSPTIGDIASLVDAKFDADAADAKIEGLAPIETAGPRDLAYIDNPRYFDALATTRAAAVLLREQARWRAPVGVAALIVQDPGRAYARVAAHLVPESLRPRAMFGAGISALAHVDKSARIEPGVDIEPGAVVGPGAEIGTGTLIAANAVVSAGVRIGRDCAIGAGASLSHALVGDRVILHPGVRVGQDGFRFALGARGHLKVPQLGRVIIQDDVEIGSNSTIDRGTTRDTIIGEGAKIDNLVQIAHNVVIGRHCALAAQIGIAGSTELGDFVLVGGQSGIGGHLVIGSHAKIAAQSGVMRDVRSGASVGGSPAQEMRGFLQHAARARRPRQGSDREIKT